MVPQVQETTPVTDISVSSNLTETWSAVESIGQLPDTLNNDALSNGSRFVLYGIGFVAWIQVFLVVCATCVFLSIPTSMSVVQSHISSYVYGAIALCALCFGVLVWVFLRCRQSSSAQREATKHAEARIASTMQEVRSLREVCQLAHAKLDNALESVRIKSEFFANMSHEIRTPMAAIIGYADLLADPAIASCDSNDAIRTIRRNGEHLLTLINDILDLTRIEAGRMSIEKLSVSPAWIVCDVVAMMKVRAQARGIALDVEWVGELPAQIVTDPHRLKQILVNLVSNAIKFTDHGAVTVRVSYDNSSGKDLLRFDVIDTGIGLTQEQQAGLFGAYAQGDVSTARKFGGSGLGLKISLHLAEILGGQILIDSKQGVGSTFSVTVETGSLEGVMMIDMNDGWDDPIEDAAPQTAYPEKLHGIRILLAEDGPDNQRLISFFLRKAGATVDIAENGRVAVEILHAKPTGYDLVVMDMLMPEMSGIEATRRLRESGCHLPILALTARVTADARRESLEAGCDEFLLKPIDRTLLIDTCARFGSTVTAQSRQAA
ncbi:MAG: response regulator [Phycisphaeraceae bacterium]|nr:response regulator [Phycisphaerales bacterium]MCB9861111.1 response regulator [Phycisphaeraceae bacterium]